MATPAKAQVDYKLVGESYNHRVFGVVDGLEYIALVPEMGLTFIIDQGDYDNDGFNDVLISWSTGGNCCPPQYSVLSYRGNGVFTHMVHEDFWSWKNPEVLESEPVARFRVDSVRSGFGLTEESSEMNVFQVTNGRLEVVENAAGSAFVPSLVELKSSHYEDYNISKTKKLRAEALINNNSQVDYLVCGWWERWGLITCDILIDGEFTISTSIGCPRVGVLSRTVEGFKSLVCGRDLILDYDIGSNSYKEVQ